MLNMIEKDIAQIHEILVKDYQKQPVLPLSFRKAQLMRLRQGIIDNQEKIYEAASKDLHRPRFETYVADVAFILQEISHALRNLKSWMKPRPVTTPMVFQPGSSTIKPSAKGVVLIIAPWNYPFQLSFVPLISAIAAGNRAIVKPSEIASLCGELITHIINSYLNPESFRAIYGDQSIGNYSLDLPFDHIFYTGSTTIGKKVMMKAAQHVTSVTLELGGERVLVSWIRAVI